MTYKKEGKVITILMSALGWRDYSMEWNYSEYGDVKVKKNYICLILKVIKVKLL